MTKNQMARKIYKAYSAEAFGKLALSWNRLRPHEKHFWLTAGQAALDAIRAEPKYYKGISPEDVDVLIAKRCAERDAWVKEWEEDRVTALGKPCWDDFDFVKGGI
ncbi:MAG: hypothetical protein KJN72_10660 [Woeseia sp.]|nr:hypothetical protein [Woeseia sp.]